MNPWTCDALVVGAGPAGSACALVLARAGFDVVLLDRQRFPRDKICGDGLMPDAHKALDELGLLPEVMARALRASQVKCVGPRGGEIDIPGQLAMLPRFELDEIIRAAAVGAGARWCAPGSFEAPLFDSGHRVCGASVVMDEARPRQLRARWTVLATGAATAPLVSAGVCERRQVSAFGLRSYVRNEGMSHRITEPRLVWLGSLKSGYGWIFPCGNGVFNVGVGKENTRLNRWRSAKAQRPASDNLRSAFGAFTQLHEPARELLAGADQSSPLKGAPLRSGLDGARWSIPGLLVAGEAVGTTYAFTGEGIGKALETGMLAARALCAGRDRQLADLDTRRLYEQELGRLKPRFLLYDKATRISNHPWIADLLIRRANASRTLVRKLSGVLEETADPDELVNARGLVNLITGL